MKIIQQRVCTLPRGFFQQGCVFCHISLRSLYPKNICIGFSIDFWLEVGWGFLLVHSSGTVPPGV